MPPTKVELDDRDESLDRIIDCSHRQQCFGMRHETDIQVSTSYGLEKQRTL
jgi:hypothetical protein